MHICQIAFIYILSPNIFNVIRYSLINFGTLSLTFSEVIEKGSCCEHINNMTC